MNKKILTVANQKGGVAKSTTCALIGSNVASKGVKTLLVDLDPQGNLSAKFLKMTRDMGGDDIYAPPPHPADPEGRVFTSAALYTNDGWDAYPTATPNLFILPASSNLSRDGQYPKNAKENLTAWMNEEELWDNFDLVIFDTPPAKNLFSESAILAATHVLIPCPMEQSPFEGLLAVVHFISVINDPLDLKDAAQIIGILPTLFQGQPALQKSFMQQLKNSNDLKEHALDFEVRWRPTYQQIEMLTTEQPYEIKKTKKNKGAYDEWQTLGDFVMKKMDL